MNFPFRPGCLPHVVKVGKQLVIYHEIVDGKLRLLACSITCTLEFLKGKLTSPTDKWAVKHATSAGTHLQARQHLLTGF